MHSNDSKEEAFREFFYENPPQEENNYETTDGPLHEKMLETIEAAKRKLNTKSENELCRYIPHPAGESSPDKDSGGYIHHFTMRKLKSKQPQKIIELVEEYILHPEHPQELDPKERAARGSRKKQNQVFFSQSDLRRMLDMAISANDEKLIRTLTPKMDIYSLKKDLITSIREGKVKTELWEAYVESVTQSPRSNELQNAFDE